jgi:hypothetical protein
MIGGAPPFRITADCPTYRKSFSPSSERKGASMRSRSSFTWTVGLLSGLAALAPFSSPALADESNPVALNTPAPELVGGDWRNTPGNALLSLAAERGKVTILHFWTFG